MLDVCGGRELPACPALYSPPSSVGNSWKQFLALREDEESLLSISDVYTVLAKANRQTHTLNISLAALGIWLCCKGDSCCITSVLCGRYLSLSLDVQHQRGEHSQVDIKAHMEENICCTHALKMGSRCKMKKKNKKWLEELVDTGWMHFSSTNFNICRKFMIEMIQWYNALQKFSYHDGNSIWSNPVSLEINNHLLSFVHI